MSTTKTVFDTSKHHIHVEFYVQDPHGVWRSLDGVIDTGAPRTEFSDKFLDYVGFINLPKRKIKIASGLQTQKYAKTVIPCVKICGHSLDSFEVYVSRFETTWGVDALIGLDFFRRFRVTIDYQAGHLVTERFAA